MTSSEMLSSFEFQTLITQYGMLISQIVLVGVTVFFYRQLVQNDNLRELRAFQADVKHWCKCVFRTAGNSPGMLQRAGQQVRERYPEQVNLILIAYDELLVEESSLRLPSLYSFLQYMEGVESGMWPNSAEALTGRLNLYKKKIIRF